MCMPNNFQRSHAAPKNRGKIISTSAYLDVTYPPCDLPRSAYPDSLAEWLHRHLYKRRGTLLDVGCGNGDFLAAFHRQGYSVAGVDISPKSKDLIGTFEISITDFTTDRLAYDDATFEFVFCKSVIEHLGDPIPLLQECHRVLAPGGIAVMLTPSWEHTYWGPFFIDHTHVTPFTKVSLQNAMLMSGFSAVRCSYFRQLPLLWKYPFLSTFSRFISIMPLPYRPHQEFPWPESVNKLIRFSKEVMLLGVGTKSDQPEKA